MVFLVGTVSAFGLGIDTSVNYNDERGYYYYIAFPFSQSAMNFLSLLGIVDDIFIDEEGNTLIDVNDLDYILHGSLRDKQVDELTFLQWFQYVNYVRRLDFPLEKIYMWGYNANGKVEPVMCVPYDTNGDHIYEMRCIPAT